MPKQFSTQISERKVLVPGGNTRNNYLSEVVARPSEVGHIQAPNVQHDGDLSGLLNGLSQFNNKLTDYFQQQDAQDAKAGAVDRATGQASQESGAAYARGYMGMDGQVKGDQDGAQLWEEYHTGFDKDAGNIDDFLAQKYGANMQGVEDQHFKGGYDKAIIPIIGKIRDEQQAYHAKKVKDTVEANGMYIIDRGLSGYTQNGQPVPEDYLDSARLRLKELGISGTRFNELLFEAAQKQGENGNAGIFDMFKRDRPDGTPGMYFIPAWKEKIDIAQNRAIDTFNRKRDQHDKAVREDRQVRQDEAMLDIVTDTDAASREAKFAKLEGSHLFSNASEFLKWRKALDDTNKKDARVDQEENETAIMANIVTGGKVDLNEIMNADLTPAQRRRLFGDIARNKREAATAAAQQRAANAQANASNAEARRASREELTPQLQYLDGVLSPGASKNDFYGTGNQVQRQLKATAKREFLQAVQAGEKPADAADRIVKRTLPRLTEMQNARPGDELKGLLLYRSPEELVAAYKSGYVNDRDFAAQKAIIQQIESTPPKGK